MIMKWTVKKRKKRLRLLNSLSNKLKLRKIKVKNRINGKILYKKDINLI